MTVTPGVRWGKLNRRGDPRGSFREVWRRSQFGALDRVATGQLDAAFVQANISASAQDVLRGLHYHRRQLDYWVLLSGRVFVALVDVRAVLAGGEPIVETRVIEPDESVVIPAGVAHGFLALDPCELLYLVTNEYDGSDELGFAWNDPSVGVPWPITDGRKPILSERDQTNPPLRELLRELRVSVGS